MTDHADWRDVRRHLEGLRDAVAAEIRSSPAPIPACDAQFNHLLERRRSLVQEIARLDEAHRAGDRALAEFVRASPFVDQVTSR